VGNDVTMATLDAKGCATVRQKITGSFQKPVVEKPSILMSLTGPPEGPPCKSGTSIADLAAGMFAALGILVALHARARTGLGQHVDVSMLDCQISLLSYHAQASLTGHEPERLGNAHPSVAPYETFRARDGWLNLGIGNDSHWRAFARAILGRPDLAEAGGFATNAERVGRRDELRALLAPLLAGRPVDAWLADLDAAGIPCGPILSVGQALAHPQARARRMVTEVAHPTLGALPVVGVPVRLSDTPGSVRSAAPLLGQHGDEILREIAGLDDDAIASLAAEGAVLRFPRSCPDET